MCVNRQKNVGFIEIFANLLNIFAFYMRACTDYTTHLLTWPLQIAQTCLLGLYWLTLSP